MDKLGATTGSPLSKIGPYQKQGVVAPGGDFQNSPETRSDVANGQNVSLPVLCEKRAD